MVVEPLTPVRRVAAWTAAVVPLMLVGCTPSSDMHAVTGSVTLSGQSLDHGTIEFVRAVDPPEAAGGAMITDGRYAISAQHGLKPGEYKVLIRSPALAPYVGDDPMFTPPAIGEERIPPEFNSQSKVHIEVRANAPNQFDFKIP